MGHAQLIESIFHCMLIYTLHVYMWPIKILTQVNILIKKLSWSGDIYSKVCIASLNSICLPSEVGDLDPKSSCYINESLVFHLSTTDIHLNGI